MIQIFMWLGIWNFSRNPRIVVLPITPLRTQNCMVKVVSISRAFVRHVVLIDNILYVTWKGITWINTLAGVSWPATSQAVVQCYKLYNVVFVPPRYCTFLMHKGGGGEFFMLDLINWLFISIIIISCLFMHL